MKKAQKFFERNQWNKVPVIIAKRDHRSTCFGGKESRSSTKATRLCNEIKYEHKSLASPPKAARDKMHIAGNIKHPRLTHRLVDMIPSSLAVGGSIPPVL